MLVYLWESEIHCNSEFLQVLTDHIFVPRPSMLNLTCTCMLDWIYHTFCKFLELNFLHVHVPKIRPYIAQDHFKGG